MKIQQRRAVHIQVCNEDKYIYIKKKFLSRHSAAHQNQNKNQGHIKQHYQLNGATNKTSRGLI